MMGPGMVGPGTGSMWHSMTPPGWMGTGWMTQRTATRNSASSVGSTLGATFTVASSVRSATVRALAWVLAIVIPILVGASRLYRGMHQPTDVMGRVVLGVGSLLFALLAVRTAVSLVTDAEVLP